MESLRKRLAVLAALVGGLFLVGGGVANAAVDPGTTTAITSGFSDLQTIVVTVLAVALFAIAVAALAIKMGVKWLRKGASQ